MRPLSFDKYEGLGNDFVVIEAPSVDAFSAARACALCDRRFGIGADGVLLVLPSADAHARMHVINSDGSVPEMCGNGLRSVALHVARKRGLTRAELTIETGAGPRHCVVEDERGEGISTIDMSDVRVLDDVTIDVDGEAIALTLADAGNPHAVSFRSTSQPDFARIGPKLATHARFPRGTNVEFARVDGGAIELLVWERGAGATLACGTGACATVAVACAKGLAPRGSWVRVRLPGGVLDIRIDSDTGHAILRGPARHVFRGVYSERAGV